MPMEAGAGGWGCLSPTPLVPLNDGALFSRQITLPLGAFPAMHPLTPIPSALSMQPTALLSPDLFFQLHTLALSHNQHWWTLDPGKGTQG